jgi:hypothetical protein
MTGAVSVFQGDTGTLATRAFMTDQDGVLWRLDLSNQDPADWDALPFHDMFWDGAATRGQPGYEPPVLSVNEQGDLIIIHATGDTDALDGTAPNRVVSLTENIVRDSTGAVTSAGANLNWEIRLADGEQVTGPLELFDGKVYFGSFQSSTPGGDACAYGSSRLWGVEYIRSAAGTPTRTPLPALEEPVGSGTMVQYIGPFANEIIMGVGVTKRPSCFTGETIADPYFGGDRYRVTDSGGGGFELVAQVSGRTTGAATTTIPTIRRELPVPAAVSRVRSFAGSID